MNCQFHPEAEVEIHEAVEYLERRQQGLGYDFAVEVRHTIQRILDHPRAWPVLEQDIRRCLVSRFPYGVVFSAQADAVFILVVMHLHRKPGYWRQRMGLARRSLAAGPRQPRPERER